jgi:hypothetical protein
MGHQGPEPIYRGIPNDRDMDYQCTGCIWWLRHWLGAITADKLVRDGFLRLQKSSKDERIYDAASFLKELQRMQRVPDPDILPFHAQHGFDWHYIALTRPDLDEYPLDLAEAFCGNLLVEDEYIEAVSNDIGRECRHGFGHAMFYILTLRENGGLGNFSVRKQLRPYGGFVLKDEDTICEGYKICEQAPNQKVETECRGGMRHSAGLYDIRRNATETAKIRGDEKKRCYSRKGPSGKA